MKHISHSRMIAMPLAMALLASGCMTTPQRTRTVRPAPVMENKSGSKDDMPTEPASLNAPSVLIRQPPIQNTPLVLAPTASNDQMLDFVHRHGASNAPLATDDEQLLSLIHMPQERGSLGEAVLAIAAIKTGIAQTGATVGGLRETDLVPTAAKKTPAAPAVALEGLMHTRQVEFLAALESNPFLQGYPIYSMTSALLEKSADSKEYKDKVNGIIQNQANRWAALTPKTSVPPLIAAPGWQNPTTPAVVPGMASGIPTPTPVDMAKIGENPVGDAQVLANQSRYRDAVAKVQQVPPGHPQYTQAQEKLKLYSNKAVQELRRKAAKAMQDANSASDTRTRISYLQQAKTHLENAINDFPEADMLGTVRENLEYISGNIDKLKSAGN